MNKRFFILISLLLISLTTSSQNEKFIFKTCPFSLIDDFSFAVIQGGIETKLTERLSLYNEFGIRYRSGYFEKYDTSFIRSYGFKVKSEIRYYLPRKIGVEKIRTVFSGPYLGANVFYIRDVRNSEIEYHPNKDTAVTAFDDFGVRKNVIGLNLILGIDKKITKSFSIDVYAGFGYRFRFIKNSFREFDPEKDTRVKPDGLTVRGIRDDVDVKTGFSATPGLTGGLRLGFSF